MLEIQQQDLLYRATLVVIPLLNSFALVSTGYRNKKAKYVSEWGVTQTYLGGTPEPGGCRTL